MCQATDFEAVENHLVGHALTDLYRLYEQAKQRPDADAAADAGNPLSFFVAHIQKADQPYRNQASQSSNFIASLPA